MLWVRVLAIKKSNYCLQVIIMVLGQLLVVTNLLPNIIEINKVTHMHTNEKT
jgi:hypothetical protein